MQQPAKLIWNVRGWVERQLAWFNNPHWHPLGRVLLPFGTTTLEVGFSRLADAGLIERRKMRRDPRTKERFAVPRVLYHNRFNKLDPAVRRISPSRYAEAVD